MSWKKILRAPGRRCGTAWTSCSGAGSCHLVDTQNLLREETSLASFTAGFKLAWGLSKELEADGLYSFDEEETKRVCHRIEQED